MMRGVVNESGCAMVSVDLRPSSGSDIQTTEVWIDTGFTGELALPRDLIHGWSLPAGGLVRAILADGSETPGIIYAEIDPARVAKIRNMMPSLQHDRSYTNS